MTPQLAAMFVVGRASARGTFENATVIDVLAALGMLACVFLVIWIIEKVENR